MARSNGGFGDVGGTSRTSTRGAVGQGIDVSNASYDTTYELGASMEAATPPGSKRVMAKRADLIEGYISYGEAIGE